MSLSDFGRRYTRSGNETNLHIRGQNNSKNLLKLRIVDAELQFENGCLLTRLNLDLFGLVRSQTV